MKILLIGPRGCGKTKNATKIAETFGATKIFDNIEGVRFGKDDQLRSDVDGLFICSKLPRGIRREHFDIVIEVNNGEIK